MKLAKTARLVAEKAANAVDGLHCAAQTSNLLAALSPDEASPVLRGVMSQVFSFDTTDVAIIRELRANGRANNQQIAEKLGLTATTVSTRIRRMEDANQLRVVAVSDFSAHGFNVLLRISVSVDGRPASDVAHELAALPEVVAAHLVTGGYDIDMLVALHDFDDLSGFLLDKLSGVRGIRTLTPAIVVDIIKYKFDVAPIEGRA